jgi:hypothetical protein
VDLATSVRAATPFAEGPAGRAVLNIGFGMGIVDGALQRRRPGRHVIVEAHPAVIKKEPKRASTTALCRAALLRRKRCLSSACGKRLCARAGLKIVTVAGF